MKSEQIDRLIDGLRSGALDSPLATDDREMLELMTSLRDTMHSEDESSVMDHPSADAIDWVARHGVSGLPSHMTWVGEHLRQCSACSMAADAAKRTLDDAPHPSSKPVVESKPSLWRMLTDAMLQPAFAAAYLIALVGLASWIAWSPSGQVALHPELLPAPQIVFPDPLERSMSGGESVLELPTSALEAPRAHLLIQSDRDDLSSGGTVAAQISQDGRVIWQRELSGAEVSTLGMVSLLVESDLLERGTIYDISLTVAEAEIFSRPIRFGR